MDIDVVYTWVNDADPAWRAMHCAAVAKRHVSVHENASVDDPARYQSRGELYYSVRSVQRYAPWVRNIFVLTNCQLPEWARNVKNLIPVQHEDVFDHAADLPTFNSHAIETVLHRISGLSNNFLYLNDDFFLLRPVGPEEFFSTSGQVYYFPSKHDIPMCMPCQQRRPVDNGAINASRLLKRDFGFMPDKKLHHAPYPLSRTVLQEIEVRYEGEVRATRSHAFRDPADLAMATTMHAYYAECTGRGRSRSVPVRYVDIGDWRFVFLVHPWSPLMRGKYQFLCLNEVGSIIRGSSLRDQVVRRTLRKLDRNDA